MAGIVQEGSYLWEDNSTRRAMEKGSRKEHINIGVDVNGAYRVSWSSGDPRRGKWSKFHGGVGALKGFGGNYGDWICIHFHWNGDDAKTVYVCLMKKGDGHWQSADGKQTLMFQQALKFPQTDTRWESGEKVLWESGEKVLLRWFVPHPTDDNAVCAFIRDAKTRRVQPVSVMLDEDPPFPTTVVHPMPARAAPVAATPVVVAKPTTRSPPNDQEQNDRYQQLMAESMETSYPSPPTGPSYPSPWSEPSADHVVRTEEITRMLHEKLSLAGSSSSAAKVAAATTVMDASDPETPPSGPAARKPAQGDSEDYVMADVTASS